MAGHLWASSDRMRSWRQVDHDLPATVTGFWLQPAGSGLLVVVNSGPDASSSQLYRSPDNGATWQPLHLDLPGGLPPYFWARYNGSRYATNGIVARSLAGRFTICVSNGAAATAAANGPPPEVMCSSDGGNTWLARSLPLFASTDGSRVATGLVGIADDGALLAVGPATLYRLGAGTTRWQSLGPLPGAGVIYSPAPGSGLLWAVPAGRSRGRRPRP